MSLMDPNLGLSVQERQAREIENQLRDKSLQLDYLAQVMLVEKIAQLRSEKQVCREKLS